ncbi:MULTISPECIES: MauE/DoxX family redox-associated membrane protein [Microbacterium]|uniref:MauE/DoxX family redox-associated membrane protein n=1 Tax=Microbacterium TaxID=33882 RepID=UPI002782EB80|nr:MULTISPECIES: MauE/DoxX family redox-associated membrane protein [Microbacterium]MDQ1075552.1 putative membrane protein YphA (DoxX/SURF4 family) [Microbacterium sp. SORGH_AS_0969]MDQ1115791.1 putative membrane protein YphA (DoxX/SURF4 family) [Microbacterium testaceum]
MPVLTTLPPLLLLVVLGVSGVSKLLDLDSAATTMRALRLGALPAPPTVAAVASVELAVALGLAFGTRELFSGAAVASLVVTLAFLAVAVRAQQQHSTDECGCFGRVASTRVGPWMTARNVALAVLASATLAGAIIDPPSNALLTRTLSDPLTAVSLVIVVAAIAVIGASFRPDSATATSAAELPLLTPDGTVVVPRQRALRGRAQLLLFVRRGCAPCEALIERATTDLAELDTIDVRLIGAVGDDHRPATDEPIHTDLSGTFAESLGVPPERPAGILLTTSGDRLLPFAVGADETNLLIDTVVAALAEQKLD